MEDLAFFAVMLFIGFSAVGLVGLTVAALTYFEKSPLSLSYTSIALAAGFTVFGFALSWVFGLIPLVAVAANIAAILLLRKR